MTTILRGHVLHTPRNPFLELGALEFLVKADTTPAGLVASTQRLRGSATKRSAGG